MAMLAQRGNVLQVVMLGVRGHPCDPVLWVLPHAIGMADVEIQPHPGRIDAFGELQVLLETLDQQSRLGLDKQENSQRFSQFDARHDFIVENRRGGLPRPAFFQRPAGLGLDRRPAKVLGQLQGPLGMLAADGPIVTVGLDPGRMPVRLPGIGHGVHHEAVDVRNRHSVPVEARADLAKPLGQQPSRPGMGHVGQQLHAAIAQGGNAGDGLFQRVVQVGVGTESKLHKRRPTSKIREECSLDEAIIRNLNGLST